MRKYYVSYFADFGNTFNLFYVDDDMNFEVPKKFERISRKQALQMASNQRRNQAVDYNSNCYGDTEIYPADYHFDDDILNDRRYKLINHIWEKVK